MAFEAGTGALYLTHEESKGLSVSEAGALPLTVLSS